MASITIPHGHKNLVFAACVANETNAQFEEDGEAIIISDSPELVIPSYCFRDAMGGRAQPGDRAWRSLILNKDGYLKYFGDDEIVISDTKPSDKRPSYLLRFESEAQKQVTEQWATDLGYDDLRQYLLAAIEAYNASWQAQRG